MSFVHRSCHEDGVSRVEVQVPQENCTPRIRGKERQAAAFVVDTDRSIFDAITTQSALASRNTNFAVCTLSIASL